jgi:hypothetical protein
MFVYTFVNEDKGFRVPTGKSKFINKYKEVIEDGDEGSYF